ncbi:MAG TPA: FAD/NAD(P)-binding protein [Acidobacteriota bacterium]|nr:FAD/NAD(P)-binding protein [Acidobacteriota bacterium]
MVPVAESAVVGPRPADPMRPLRYRVEQVRRETHDTFSLRMSPVDGWSIGSFAPGQFNMLYAFGTGEAAISISADPGNPARLWHTIRRAGIVTHALGRLQRGDMLGVRGPFGSAWPVAAAVRHDVLLIAGGIGLAPLRPALYHILAARKEYRNVSLLYGARTPDDILFRRELGEWRARLDLHVGVTVDHAPTSWRGDVGVVTTLIPRAPFDPANTMALTCGPELMMRFAAEELADCGVPRERIYLSMERNMKCAVGFCGHCQYGPTFICKDGPVFRYDHIHHLLVTREI